MHAAPERYLSQAMVNRIDENNYYNHTKKKNVNIPDTDEKFSLDYRREELQTEDKGKKDKADESEKSRKQSDGQNGVRLELSSRGKTASAGGQRTADAAKTQDLESKQSIMGMIREIMTTAVSAVKDFFYKIWNEPDTKAETEVKDRLVTSADITDSTDEADSENIAGVIAMTDSVERYAEKQGRQTEIPEAGIRNAAETQKMAEARLDREIRPYLRKGDINQVINLLTDNGKKTVAMNSTLLSYYDRNGKMVEINASDRERILRGDRNSRKL